MLNHSLFLIAGLDHRKTSLSLYGFEIMLILMVGMFHTMTVLLRINQGMEKWLLVIPKP